jgi:predicted metalloprotease with PDZ domain
MPAVTKRLWLAVVVTLALAGPVRPQSTPGAIQYRFAFPELQHRWMQVDVSFEDLSASQPLELHMSRSSPGRYAVHDFAKNVYDLHAFDRDGRELAITRTDASVWTVPDHGTTVMVRYKVYGDRVDGTYLAVDETHAHINMPAALLWARGFDDRSAVLTFVPPIGVQWRLATQLYQGTHQHQLTAPNLQYLMDSPVEFGPLALREFTVGARRFRVAVHHTGTSGDVDSFVSDVARIIREEGAIFGEYPEYEPGSYTFLADCLPFAHTDGMEHRNSNVITSDGTIATSRARLLDSVAHEFFHSWNVERIRPAGIEPFDFDRANLTRELWLAEGFTQYYGPLVLERAGLTSLDSAAQTFTRLVDAVTTSPARFVRSAQQMSEMAAFIDGGHPVDRTNWPSTVLSYYAFGGAIGLALDLTLREKSESRVSLDDFMRVMWTRFGRAGTRSGYVDRPYSAADVELVLADLTGDRAFASEFLARYIEGRAVAEYDRLLGPAGFVLRKRTPGRAWLGDLRFASGSLQIANLVSPSWPAYAAGVDQDDELQWVNGLRLRSSDDLTTVLARHRPGDRIELVFTDRTSRSKAANVTLLEDPHVEVVPLEATGAALTPAQQAFRDAWLGSKK